MALAVRHQVPLAMSTWEICLEMSPKKSYSLRIWSNRFRQDCPLKMQLCLYTLGYPAQQGARLSQSGTFCSQHSFAGVRLVDPVLEEFVNFAVDLDTDQNFSNYLLSCWQDKFLREARR